MRFFLLAFTLVSLAYGDNWDALDSILDPNYRPRNMVPALEPLGETRNLPILVTPHDVHERGKFSPLPVDASVEAVVNTPLDVKVLSQDTLYGPSDEGASWTPLPIPAGIDAPASCTSRVRAKLQARHFGSALPWDALKEDTTAVNDLAQLGGTTWIATDAGLYRQQGTSAPEWHRSYGVDGPLATTITALTTDTGGRLWVGTPVGLSLRETDGTWSSLRGRDGLPYADISALACDSEDNLWIGTSRGVIHYRPKDETRKWYYRAGPRYLPDDNIHDLAVSADGRRVYVLTASGPGVIDVVSKALHDKATRLEALVEKRHRRLGLVAACRFPDTSDLSTFTIPDSPNDGLWTAYHVTAMSLAYATTGKEAHKASAREGMHAIYMLQNASGVPGIPARSVVLTENFDETKLSGSQEWHKSEDGTYWWRGDTSSDEYCGHYLAFYAYWEHVAQHDPEEATLLEKQLRTLTDYLLKNNYQLIDVDGQRTRWGVWNPEALNGDPDWQIENGLNALQITSFLRVAHYITGDQRYEEHYLRLMQDHDYLSNILTEKKVFPDEVNHSDDQLGFCAWYPILQIERDPKIRYSLHQAVRRHWIVEAPERPSFFTFIYATIDPNHADLVGAIRNLQEIPEDRRDWRMENSHRADVTLSSRVNRFDDPVITTCLPADERNFEKWNADPFEPDGGSVDGHEEQTGATYLLPYWMGRYHGFFTEE